RLAELVGRLVQGLGGAAEVWIHGDVPRVKQPFWDVESVSVSLAPVAERLREDIGLWRQLQLPDLHFEFGRKIWSGLHETAPVRIAAHTSHNRENVSHS